MFKIKIIFQYISVLRNTPELLQDLWLAITSFLLFLIALFIVIALPNNSCPFLSLLEAKVKSFNYFSLKETKNIYFRFGLDFSVYLCPTEFSRTSPRPLNYYLLFHSFLDCSSFSYHSSK